MTNTIAAGALQTNNGNNAATDYTVVVPAGSNTFQPDGNLATTPGSSVMYPHTFTAGLAGILQGEVTPASAAHWLETLGIIATSWVLILATARLSRDLARPVAWLSKLAPGSMQMYFNILT